MGGAATTGPLVLSALCSGAPGCQDVDVADQAITVLIVDDQLPFRMAARAVIRRITGLTMLITRRNTGRWAIVSSMNRSGSTMAIRRSVRARSVISNADPGATFQRLVEPEQLPAGIRRKLAKTRMSTSARASRSLVVMSSSAWLGSATPLGWL